MARRKTAKELTFTREEAVATLERYLEQSQKAGAQFVSIRNLVLAPLVAALRSENTPQPDEQTTNEYERSKNWPYVKRIG